MDRGRPAHPEKRPNPDVHREHTTLILAAGRSRRMGFPKAKLLYAGQPLWWCIWKQAQAANARRIVIVAGQADSNDPTLLGCEEILARVAEHQAANWLHPSASPSTSTSTSTSETVACVGAPDCDAMASLRIGLSHVPPGDALVLWPVDHPFASSTLVADLVAPVCADPTRIALPTVDLQHGHPVAIGSAVVDELRTSAPGATARTVLRAVPSRRIYVPTTDPRVALTLNTPAQAAACGLSRPQ